MERREIPSVNSILEKLDLNQINLPRESILLSLKTNFHILEYLIKKIWIIYSKKTLQMKL